MNVISNISSILHFPKHTHQIPDYNKKAEGLMAQWGSMPSELNPPKSL